MSKEEQSPCKVSLGSVGSVGSVSCVGAGKHKERKPKKPHYIPRPWGKPYNYKCFQCPFTCMEKSHLYNHMKYSLCKNSLSLLIDSDWPYKKGNMLHHPADQLRLQQQQQQQQQTATVLAQRGSRSPNKEHSEREANTAAAPSLEHSPSRPTEEDKRGEEPRSEEGKASSNGRPESVAEGGDVGGARHAKQEADVVMADAFSLEEQLLRARSFEVENRLRQYRLPKACLSSAAPTLLPDSWRLLGCPPSTQQATKPKPEVPSAGDGRGVSSLPCYPSAPPLPSEPPAFNLSLLGLSYPLAPGLFSYLNPASTQTHAQLTTLPFLTHPHTQTDTRTLLPPRFYYPFLCEHSLANSSPSTLHPAKTLKSPQLSGQDASSAPTTPPYPPKLSLWGVPAVRQTSTQASPTAWPSPEGISPEPRLRAGDKSKSGVWGLEHGLKRPAAPSDLSECPAEKRPALGGLSLDLLRSLHRSTPSAAMATEKLLLHSSADEWYTNLRRAVSTSPPREVLVSPSPAARGGGGEGEKAERREQTGEDDRDRDRDREAILLEDLSSALQEYQQAEQRAASILAQDGASSAQLLWDHLSQIRSQLSHITQALQRTAPSAEGPLDLSVKRDPIGVTQLTRDGSASMQSMMGEMLREDMSSGSDEEEEEEEEEQERDEREEEEVEDGGRELKEKRKRSLDLLIKLNQSGVSLVKGGEGVWPGRATKCEADSSVLLCPNC
ncbi:proline-rich protein 35 [Engraulis encrasicolus]|uniref:proline-rich protein 35 n=1 Tax=Engraulis encrasicolus TaxID=184585 RepID=UPI002FD668D8